MFVDESGLPSTSRNPSVSGCSRVTTYSGNVDIRNALFNGRDAEPSKAYAPSHVARPQLIRRRF
jgi:hypothetical protein